MSPQTLQSRLESLYRYLDDEQGQHVHANTVALAIEEVGKIEKLETNLRHWREECGKLNAAKAVLRADLTEAIEALKACNPPKCPICGGVGVHDWNCTLNR